MKSLLFCAKLVLHGFLTLKDKYMMFKKLGGMPPTGCTINKICKIEIGTGFGLSRDCKLLCQDSLKDSFLKIGANVKLNFNVMINADCGGRITIGNNVLIGPNVVIRAANHQASNKTVPIIQQGHRAGEIVIEDDVWIGANVVVLPDVRIPRGCIVAAGSVVTRNIDEEYSVVGGVPAKFLKKR